VSVGNGPISLSDNPVAYARLDRARYLRSASYDTYNGRGWSLSRASTSFNFTEANTRNRREILDAQEFGWRVEVVGNTGGRLPMPGEPISWDSSSYVRPQPDATFSISSGTYPELSGTSIEARDIPESGSAVDDMPLAWTEMLNSDQIPERVYQFAQEAVAGSTNDLDKARRIRDEIAKRARYNLRASAIPAGVDAVDHFLFVQQEGYCDLFASSMVLMARSVGIPARYMTGYFPMSGRRDDLGRFVVREADGHAWAELFFEGLGWVVFDATEGAIPVEGSAVGASTDNGPWYEQPWFRMLLQGIAAIGIIALVWFGGRWLLKSRADRSTERAVLDRAYLRFTHALATFSGKRRRLGETPEEYLKSVLPSLNGSSQEAKAITQAFVSAFYSQAPLSLESSQTLMQRVRKFEEQLRKKENRKPPARAIVEMQHEKEPADRL
jgi:transglutaminase-like putative cysteine protease